MKYKICNYNNFKDFAEIHENEMQILIAAGIFDDCPDESDTPTYNKDDDSIIGIFSTTNVPIITHRLKYYIKKNNITDQSIIQVFNWIKTKTSPIIIFEINE